MEFHTSPPPHVASSPSTNVKSLARRFEYPSGTPCGGQKQQQQQQQGQPLRSKRQLHFTGLSSSAARKLGRLRSRSLSPPMRRLSEDATARTDQRVGPSQPVSLHVNGLSVPSKSPSPVQPSVPSVYVEVGQGSGAPGACKELETLKAEIIEARKQVATLTEEAKQKEQVSKLLTKKLEESGTSRAGRGPLKQWLNWKPQDLSNVLRKLPRHDVVEDPEEIIHLFIEAEKIYVDSLHALEFFYHEPLKTLSVFKPDVLTCTQLGSLFLNCSELLVVHRFLLQELSHILSLPRALQLEELLTTLERFFPSFSLYGPHLATGRDQSLQKEYRTCLQRPQFKQLLDHCQNKCEGKGLLDFLNLPSERLSDYVSLLGHFLGAHMRNVSDAAVKRAEILISYLNKLKYGFQEQHSEWEHAQEKIKVLLKLAPEAPVPMEMFEADVELVKQGPLTMVKGSKEISCTGLLFKTYFAIADRPSGTGEGTHLRVLEYGMIPLSSAQLHKCVDVEGQTMQPDLQSGLSEDRMGFTLSFKKSESLFFRVAKPNERKAWVEMLEKCIQDAHCANHSQDETDHVSFSPEVGPKIAAASMEKLFQQLTSPHTFRDDFVEVFLMTHSCFTTSKNVLTALINCINSPSDNTPSTESSNPVPETSIFTFNDLSEPSSANTSVTDISLALSNYHLVCTSESENESPSASPSFVRRPLPPVPAHTQKGEVALVSSGRVVVGSTTSTSDSDVSPHTSAIVVDNGSQPEHGTQNGWQSSEVFVRGGEQSLYVTLCPPEFRKMSHSSDHHSWGDAEDSDCVDEEEEGGEGNVPTPSNSSKTLKLEDLHEDITPVMTPSVRTSVRGKSADTELDGDQEASSSTFSTQHTAALCTSEPNLFAVSIQRKTSPTPPTPPSTSKESNFGFVNPSLSLNLTMPPSSARAQPFHHGMAMTAPPGRLREYMLAGKGLQKSATMDKKPKKGKVELTASLGVSAQYFDLAFCEGAQTSSGPKKPKRGIKQQIVSKLNKMRGKKAVKLAVSGDEMGAPGETKPRRSLTFKHPSRNTSLTESLGGVGAGSSGEHSFAVTIARTGSMSSGVGTSQYTTLLSKIFAVLNCWQEWHFEDFERDKELKSMLDDFLNTVLTRHQSDTHPYRLAKHLAELMKGKEPVRKDGTLPSLLSRVAPLNSAEVKMYNWDNPEKLKPKAPLDLSRSALREGPGCRAIAQQLTLMEFAVYKAVERYELLNCNWKKSDKERLAPNVCRLIRRTNELTSWVCTEVLSQDTPQARANVIELFIDVAKYCYSHNDFHCSLNITIALKSSAVKGLAKTWALVDKKSRHRLERLSKFTDYNGRCKKLRETLEQLTEDSLEKNETLPSALPYLGAYLDQIYTLEMSTKTFNPDRLVNFVKMTKLSDLVRTALQYQESKYPFEPQLDIMVYIMSAKRLSENELYDLSMKLEPRS